MHRDSPHTPHAPNPYTTHHAPTATEENSFEQRLLAELPQLKVPFKGAWEAELATYQARMAPLAQATLKAQAHMRAAAVILADAEAQRGEAGERRRIYLEQLHAGGIEGIMGV